MHSYHLSQTSSSRGKLGVLRLETNTALRQLTVECKAFAPVSLNLLKIAFSPKFFDPAELLKKSQMLPFAQAGGW